VHVDEPSRTDGPQTTTLRCRLPRHAHPAPVRSSVEQLEFNVAAADIELSAEAVAALTAAARAFRPVSAGRTLIDTVREKLPI